MLSRKKSHQLLQNTVSAFNTECFWIIWSLILRHWIIKEARCMFFLKQSEENQGYCVSYHFLQLLACPADIGRSLTALVPKRAFHNPVAFCTHPSPYQCHSYFLAKTSECQHYLKTKERSAKHCTSERHGVKSQSNDPLWTLKFFLQDTLAFFVRHNNSEFDNYS